MIVAGFGHQQFLIHQRPREDIKNEIFRKGVDFFLKKTETQIKVIYTRKYMLNEKIYKKFGIYSVIGL